MVVTICVGSAISAESSAVHPFKSDTVTKYLPAVKPLIAEVVAVVDQANVNPPAPPDGVTSAVPVDPPKQSTSVVDTMVLIKADCVIVIWSTAVQLLASLTVTV